MAWRKPTKQQWEARRVHLPQRKATPRGGHPRVDDRRCFEGILWILWTGAQWSELSKRYGSPKRMSKSFGPVQCLAGSYAESGPSDGSRAL
jgi:transposase